MAPLPTAGFHSPRGLTRDPSSVRETTLSVGEAGRGDGGFRARPGATGCGQRDVFTGTLLSAPRT